MDQVKRKLTIDQSSEDKTKKLRSEFNQSTTCIENLSNEFFYEIFDYLDGYDIYKAFSNLNDRFQRFFNSSSLLLKIKLDYPKSEDIPLNNLKEFMFLSKQQIFSFHLEASNEVYSQLISSLTSDPSFNRLESLILDEIKPDVLSPILINLSYLPRLFALTINIGYTLEDLSDIYRLIFDLPKLRYIKFSAQEEEENCEITVSLPIATSKRFNTIEHLVIDHFCTFKHLSAIISYTPQLSSLKFTYEIDSNIKFRFISPITLSNLTYMSICMYHVEFNEFKKLISKINSKLKVLYVHTACDDIVYFNAKRWEQLLLKYFPQLEKFHLTYEECIEDDYESRKYPKTLNQFFSTFWIERQWIFEADIQPNNIMCSIRPYKRRWYEYPQNIIMNSSDQLSKSMQLILSDVSFEEYVDPLYRIIRDILNVIQIHHVHIYGQIFTGSLIRILQKLLKLDSLTIFSLCLSYPRSLSNDETTILRLISCKNRITKVNLERMNDIEEVYFLIELCPHVVYLKVGFINYMDMESSVRLILIKIMSKSNHQLRLLCFHLPTVDDKMIQNLDKMIDSEKLLEDYSMHRISVNVYLQWK